MRTFPALFCFPAHCAAYVTTENESFPYKSEESICGFYQPKQDAGIQSRIKERGT
jgi:hypothetical protein